MIVPPECLKRILNATTAIFPSLGVIAVGVDYAIPIRLIFKCADEIEKLQDKIDRLKAEIDLLAKESTDV